jgi:uncharacterized protein
MSILFTRRSFLSITACAVIAKPALATPSFAIPSDWQASLVKAAHSQIGVTKTYDPAYASLIYPNGDVHRIKGFTQNVDTQN